MSNDLVPVEGTQRTWARSPIPESGVIPEPAEPDATEQFFYDQHSGLASAYQYFDRYRAFCAQFEPVVYVNRRGAASTDRWAFNPPIYNVPPEQTEAWLLSEQARALQNCPNPYGAVWPPAGYQPTGMGGILGGLF